MSRHSPGARLPRASNRKICELSGPGSQARAGHVVDAEDEEFGSDKFHVWVPL
jgi:hypothetical protein